MALIRIRDFSSFRESTAKELAVPSDFQFANYNSGRARTCYRMGRRLSRNNNSGLRRIMTHRCIIFERDLRSLCRYHSRLSWPVGLVQSTRNLRGLSFRNAYPTPPGGRSLLFRHLIVLSTPYHRHLFAFLAVFIEPWFLRLSSNFRPWQSSLAEGVSTLGFAPMEALSP